MRIAQISTLATPVGPTGAGSIEGLIWLLSRELMRLGHEVTIFATADSAWDGELVASLPGPYCKKGSLDDWQLCEWINICKAVEQSGRFDVLHSHSYLWSIPLERIADAPIVHTLHIMPSDDQCRLRLLYPDATVTAISRYQWHAFPEVNTSVIHHGVDPSLFTYQADPDDYVCFLGRFTPDKGPLTAIEAARSLGLPLRLAGPTTEYYHKRVEPLVDGRSVEYVGTVSGAKRDEFLGRAKALLYPIQSPEPFGLVLIEAMMCGTPVVANRIGAVPEIVDEGITGWCADDPCGFANRIQDAFQLDRKRIRDRCVERFSIERMARQYLEVYARSITDRNSASIGG